MQTISVDDKRAIVVGRPLPFSVYSSDRTLLLGAGRLVPNEFVREGLLRAGTFSGGENAGASVHVGASTVGPTDDLAQLQTEYQNPVARQAIGFQMERDGVSYRTRIVGASDVPAGLIMSSPLTAEGSVAPLHVGESWIFKALYSTVAVRFQGVIASVAVQPFPYFCASQLTEIDRRTVRRWPRTMTSLPTARAGEAQRIIVDLSVGGARLAVKHQAPLQHGQSLLLNPTLPTAVGHKALSIDATVLNLYGNSDAKHPRIDFYGVQFEKTGDFEKLLLHAYVQEHLNGELDRVWNILGLAPQ